MLNYQSSFKFEVVDPNTFGDFPLFEPGEASFVVVGANDRKEGLPLLSKKKPDGTGGNPMMMLVLKVTDSSGMTGKIITYLVNHVQWKIYEFCKSIGHEEYYHEGLLNPVILMDCTGRCEIKTERDHKGNERSVIVTFYPKNDGPSTQQIQHAAAQAFGVANNQATGEVFSDDEIPF